MVGCDRLDLGSLAVSIHLFGLTVLLARKRDRRGAIANAAMIPTCLAMAIGSLGESIAPASPDVPCAIQLFGGAVGAVVFASLAVAALKALAER